MTTTTIYRNDITGAWVKLIDVKPGVARVEDSQGYAFPMVGADYEHAPTLARARAHMRGATLVPAAAPAQMTSPLAPADRKASFLASPGASLVIPSLPQARCLVYAKYRDGVVLRGRATVDGRTAPLDVLIAMARRGWVILDHPTMPMHGRITEAGRNAVTAYVTKHGPVL